MIRRIHLAVVALPFAAILFVTFAALQWKIPLQISESEREVYRYQRHRETETAPQIAQRKPIDLPDRLRGPLRARRGPATVEAAPGVGPSPYLLTSILISKSDRKVVINDQFLREGDRLNELTVLKIGKGKVRVRRNGKTEWLSLGES